MKVICDKKDCCEESVSCGGAQLHEFDRNKCGKYPMDKPARCVLYNKIEDNLNKLKE